MWVARHFLSFVLFTVTTDIDLHGLYFPAPQQRDQFKEIPVKVHIRKPEKDTWVYVGRGLVTLEIFGHSSQVGDYLSLALLIMAQRPLSRSLNFNE